MISRYEEEEAFSKQPDGVTASDPQAACVDF